MDKKVCGECGDVIKGRSDKKFCSDMCRNAHNNKLNSDTNNYVRNVNNILRKNRRILEESLTGETTKIQKQKLTDKGFNFGFYTNLHLTKNNHSYFYCYEFGYLMLEHDLVLLVKRKEKEAQK